MPMYLIHAVALVGPFLVRFSWNYVWMAVALYVARMALLSGGYHRYFAHRSYKTSRAFQFVLAFLGGTCAQKGALWWAANHRHHHRYSDRPEDLHSPREKGLLWSHVGWILSKRFEATQLDRVPRPRPVPRAPLAGPPPLRAVAGAARDPLPARRPPGSHLGLLRLHRAPLARHLHHQLAGPRVRLAPLRAPATTRGTTPVLALITLGEGWHNNHHHYPARPPWGSSGGRSTPPTGCSGS